MTKQPQIPGAGSHPVGTDAYDGGTPESAQQPAGGGVGTPDGTDGPVIGAPGDGSAPGTQTGSAAGASDGPAAGASDGQSRQAHLAELVDQPAKVMRIGTMIKQLLDEVRSAPLDDAARTRLAAIHERSITELEDGLAPELVEELHRITLPFTDDTAPSDGELRIAQAQLVGWLEGLFHGIQAALAAQAMTNQQTAARMQQRQLPPGTLIAPGVVIGENGEPQRAPAGVGVPRVSEGEGPAGPGQYL